MKKNVFFIALFLAILARSVSFGGPVEDGNKIIAELAQEYVDKSGPAQTFSYGAILDDKNNREMFRVPSLLAEATGLDFVSLATIQHIGGDLGLYSTALNLPDSLEGKAGALKILERRQLKNFERGYYENYFGVFSGEDVSARSAKMAEEVWEAFRAEYGDLSTSDPETLAKKYAEVSEVSDLIGLDIVPLAGIRVMGGLSGFFYFLTLLPEELPGREEAIKIITRERKKSR